jgi:hypothetical protein
MTRGNFPPSLHRQSRKSHIAVVFVTPATSEPSLYATRPVPPVHFVQAFAEAALWYDQLDMVRVVSFSEVGFCAAVVAGHSERRVCGRRRWLRVGRGISRCAQGLLLRSLLGVKRTRPFAVHMSASDPKQLLQRYAFLGQFLFCFLVLGQVRQAHGT